MQISRWKNFKYLAVSFMLVALAGFYSASVLTMHHESMPIDHCVTLVAPSGHQESSSACLSYHLGLMHNLSQVSSQVSVVQLLALSFVMLVFASAASLRSLLENFYSRLKNYLRNFAETFSRIFYLQLGFWIILLEKRDPSFALAKA